MPFFYSTPYPIWGEHQIQSMCVCVCLSVFPVIPARCKWTNQAQTWLRDDTHISILQKFIMIAFIIKRKRETMSKNRFVVNGGNLCVLLREAIGTSWTTLSGDLVDIEFWMYLKQFCMLRNSMIDLWWNFRFSDVDLYENYSLSSLKWYQNHLSQMLIILFKWAFKDHPNRFII